MFSFQSLLMLAAYLTAQHRNVSAPGQKTSHFGTLDCIFLLDTLHGVRVL